MRDTTGVGTAAEGLLANPHRIPIRRMIRPLALLAAALLLAACGGGSAGGTATVTPSTPVVPAGPTWTAGVYLPYSSFAAQCAVPRTGNNPQSGQPWPDRQGSIATENHWLRAWTHDLYLWFDEVVDRDPAATATTAAFFGLEKTTATLLSGQAKDRFHFTYATADWLALSQGGVQAGYGIQWGVLAAAPPRKVLVQYTEAGSPATLVTPAIGRGAEVVGVDGVDAVNDNTSQGAATINAGLFPAAAGESHTLTIRDRGATTTRSVTLRAVGVTINPVPQSRVIDTGVGRVGYLLFNDHLATAEKALVDAVNALKSGGAQDLVLDIRYNGGGYLDIANELAYMIAGPTPTAGRTFERIQFNSQHPATDPVTQAPLAPDPFFTTTQGFGQLTAGQALPSLNLARVFVLTTPDTCSASESVINSLRGIGLQVIQVGGTTCGKPYGFYPADNCGTTYFSIQFRGVNDVGFGDYAEGFSATRTTAPAQANLPGCGTPDDYAHDLGDVAEGQLAAALQYRANGSCPAITGAAQAPAVAGGLSLQPSQNPWRSNRILR
jgi:carboxyl-terminal processing protease